MKSLIRIIVTVLPSKPCGVGKLALIEVLKVYSSVLVNLKFDDDNS